MLFTEELVKDQQIFLDACREHGLGERLDIENYPEVPAFPVYERNRIIAEELIQSANHHFSNLPPIHFDFIDSGTINAWAFKHDSRYFIGITAGAIVMLHLVIDHMLARQDTFPHIGEPRNERDVVPVIDWSIIDAKRLYEMGTRPIAARDTTRLLYGRHLAEQAVMFLIGHEIAHITRGHVDYLASKSGHHFMAELGWNDLSGPLIERQAIEVDADQRSVYARCNSMFMTAESANEQSFPWTVGTVTVEALQFDWAFAVNTLFRLFGDELFSHQDLESSSYPPLPLRRRMAMDFAFQTLLENWGKEHEETINTALTSSVGATELCFNSIGAAPTAGGFSGTSTDDAQRHIEMLGDSWAALTENLRQFSYENI